MGYAPTGPALDPETPLSSMCFSLSPMYDGSRQVTSLVFTRDGAYCIAAFTSGTVRMYDLTVSGNTDPEDRGGLYLGSLRSKASSSAPSCPLTVTLRLAEQDLDMPTVTRTVTSTVSHLFCGARVGCNAMVGFDIGALRELKRRRGFVSSSVGEQFQVFQHCDARLKGFVGLSPVSCTSTAACSSTCTGAYSARYRVLCGQSYQSYHVWDVLVEASTGAGTGAGEQGVQYACTYSYTQSWSMVASGLTNTNSIAFAAFAIADPADVLDELDMDVDMPTVPVVPTPSSSFMPATSAISRMLKRSNSPALPVTVPLSVPLPVPVPVPVPGNTLSCEILVRGAEKDMKMVRLNQLTPSTSSCYIKHTSSVLAASADGTVLFAGAGTASLSVLRYLPTVLPGGGGRVLANDTFPLEGTGTRAPGTVTVRRQQLRELKSVECTGDGCYALLVCTDNAVLLYSPCNAYGRGWGPSNGPGTRTGRGFLCLLFQARDGYRLQTHIAICTSAVTRLSYDGEGDIDIDIEGDEEEESYPYLQCRCSSVGIRGPVRRGAGTGRGMGGGHAPLESVVLGLAYWNINTNASTEGVLRTVRLRCTQQGPYCTSGTHIPVSLQLQLVPEEICIPGIGLAGTGTVSSTCSTCWLCGDESIVHWDESINVNVNTGMDEVEDDDIDMDIATALEGPLDGSSKIQLQHAIPIRAPSSAGVIACNPIPNSKHNKNKNKNNNKRVFSDLGNEGSKSSSNSSSNSSSSSSSYGSSTALLLEHNSNTNLSIDSKAKRGRGTSSSSSSSTSHDEEEEGGDIAHLLEQIRQLEQDRVRLQQDNELSMRKSDRRFEQEKILRKDWNTKQAGYMETIQVLQQRVAVLTDKLTQVQAQGQVQVQHGTHVQGQHGTHVHGQAQVQHGTHVQEEYTAMARAIAELGAPLARFMSAVPAFLSSMPGPGDGDSPFAEARALYSTQVQGHVQDRERERVATIRAFFCVYCQDFTADVALQGCGHVCLCREHALQSSNVSTRRITQCPICKAAFQGFVHLNGIDRT